ncbi:MAG: sugar phosphate isomerase/epimerase [Ruminococcaceae bacterium]|nr:sugar phosphate isomerase/epimerase [Oscillospiraceae bacterium]
MKFAMYYGFVELLREKSIPEVIAYLKSFGLDGVEFIFSGTDPSKDLIGNLHTAQKLGEALKKEGIDVCCYSAYCDVYDKDEIPAALTRIEIAKALGSPFFHHTLIPQLHFPSDPKDFEQRLPYTLDVAERIANHAQKHGMTVLYEEQGRYINGVENFGIFFNEMKQRCQNVGVCADFGNILYAGEKPEDFIAAYIDDVKHVHIKDYRFCSKEQFPTMPANGWGEVPDGWVEHSVVGDGIIDLEKCLELLKKSGYDGYYSLEMCHKEPIDYGIEMATTRVKEIYERV